MRAGDLNRLVAFERRKERRNCFGEEEIYWCPYVHARAAVEQDTGKRSPEEDDGNIVSYVKTFTVRTFPGKLVNEEMSILFEGRRYRINSIIHEKDRTVVQGTYWKE